MTFKNMKIEITDEVQLKAVCDVLQSMGFKCANLGNENSGWDVLIYPSIRSWCQSMYSGNLYEPATLTDLLSMRDQLFMESIR